MSEDRCMTTGKPRMHFTKIGDDIETNCIECNEPVLFTMQDKMAVFVGKNPDGTTEVFGVYCARCAKKG